MLSNKLKENEIKVQKIFFDSFEKTVNRIVAIVFRYQSVKWHHYQHIV